MQYRLITICGTALLLGACGGDKNSNAAVDFPSSRTMYAAPAAPSADEQRQIDAGKIYNSRYDVLQGISPRTQDIFVGGKRLYRHGFDNGYYAGVDASSLPQGSGEFSGQVVYTDTGARTNAWVRSYQGFRSGAFLIHNDHGDAVFTAPFGYETPIAAIPTSGRATYTGTAMDRYDTGHLTYHVNFAGRTGNGHITGLSRLGTVTLHPASYRQQYDSMNDKNEFKNIGQATAANGTQLQYITGFYGAQAEELVGEAMGGNNAIIFHGRRDAVTE